MPFQALDRPNLGLSLLRATLERSGFECGLLYGNLRMAEEIGLDTYLVVAGLLPQELLFGDFLFAPTARGAEPWDLQDPRLRHLAARLPSWLWSTRHELWRAAELLVAGLAREIVAEEWDLVGCSLMFQVMPSLALAREIKRLRPQTQVVLGGANCEGEMGRALHESFPWVDFVGRGQGETLLVELAQHLADGSPALEDIEGLVWRRGTESVANGEQARRIRDLDSLAVPAYDDWCDQIAASPLAIERRQLRLPIETSRGCWWGQRQHCIFCGLNGESLVYDHKSAERARQEIRELSRLGIPRIYAVDLIFPHGYFHTLLPGLEADDLGVELFYEIKANLSRGHLAQLARAGVRELQPGIESLSTPILKTLRKGVSAYQNVRLLKWAAELGLQLTWNLLYGFPGESADDYAQMADLIPALTHLQPPTIGCCPVRIDRFSPLFVEAEAFGLDELAPAEAYGLVYGLPSSELHRVAYHFESHRQLAAEVEAEIAVLTREVERWQEAAGSASLLAWDRDEQTTLLFDQRPGAAVAEAALEGTERRLYAACAEGAPLPRLIEKTQRPGAELLPILERWSENRWVVKVDDRYLSVALDLECFVPNAAALPAELAVALAAGTHCRHMGTLRREVEDQVARLQGEVSRSRIAV